MGHARQALSSSGWFPGIFSISMACTTGTTGCKEAKYRNSSCPKNSQGICLSERMTCSGPEMPSARNSCCHRHFQLRLDNETHVAQWNSRWEKGRSSLAEVAAVQRPGRTQWGGANEITRLAEQKAKLREAALLMRLFGVTHSPAHPCWRRHLQSGVCCSEEGFLGSTRGVSPTPYFPTDSNTLTRGWPQCCPVCVLHPWKGYPTLAPLGQPTSTTTQLPLNKNER